MRLPGGRRGRPTILLLVVPLLLVACSGGNGFPGSMDLRDLPAPGEAAAILVVGEGGLSEDAHIYSVAAGPDGVVYLGVRDDEKGAIFAVAPDGDLEVVADEDERAFTGDREGLYPVEMTVAPSGDVYVLGSVVRVIEDGRPGRTLARADGDCAAPRPSELGLGNRWIGLAYDAKAKRLYAGDEYHVVALEGYGVVRTVAGDGAPGETCDNEPTAEGPLYGLDSITLDPDSGMLWAALRGDIVRIDPRTGEVSPVTNGESGFSDGPLSSARVGAVGGVAFHKKSGAVYFSDETNNRIRRLGTDGRITTVAGDGRRFEIDDEARPAEDAAVPGPERLTVSPAGDVYAIAEEGEVLIMVRSSSTKGTASSGR